jgi:hypothetical protein
MVIKKEIVYPIFLECMQYTKEPFWASVFESLAFGQSPFGCFFNKNSLCCNYKDKEFSYRIEKKNPEELYNDVYNLLAKKLGLLSTRDKLKKKLEFYNLEDSLKTTNKTWSAIRKKNIKDLIIENFVIEMKNKYGFDIKQSRNLLSTIFIGMIFKVFSVKDIHYQDGKILSIDGISFKKKQVIVERDIYDIENNFRKCVLIDKNLMSNNWEKYLENLKKYI